MLLKICLCHQPKAQLALARCGWRDEAIYSTLAIKTGDLPPTLNLNNPEEDMADFDLVL